MPELPEVETVRSILLPYIVGQKIVTTTISLPKVVANMDPNTFIAKMQGQTITQFTRRGKFLTLHLNSGDFVVIHFRMTGTLVVENAKTSPEKHTNLQLTFTNGQTLRYIDSRGFGHWWYFSANEKDTSGQQLLGPEPDAVTIEYLQAKLAKRQTPIKSLLLDQHIIAGIGNIYADEICFRCQIRPDRPGKTLTSTELKKLADTIPAVINEFIQIHRVPFEIFAISKGKSYQKSTNRLVYGRAGEPCQTCGQTLIGTRIGQRSSVFCQHCQK